MRATPCVADCHPRLRVEDEEERRKQPRSYNIGITERWIHAGRSVDRNKSAWTGRSASVLDSCYKQIMDNFDFFFFFVDTFILLHCSTFSTYCAYDR
jgi:hypothetical protein